ncbi:MAG: hypothetical protein PHR78_06635 [Eubacteriales bacterium]|nr:hypothetical protein [Eubacteriales bacterium]
MAMTLLMVNLSSINFSERLWLSLGDRVTMPESGENTLVFHFRSGELKNVQFSPTKETLTVDMCNMHIV